MPHLLLERIRSVPIFCASYGCAGARRGKDGAGLACAYVVDVMEITSGVIFVVASVCFLPVFSKDLEAFVEGCALFALGSFMYVLISLFCLTEAILDKGIRAWEANESALYLMGSIMFLVGTILYWPDQARLLSMRWAKHYSIGAYFNLFSVEYEATALFILGSMLFAAAALLNAWNQKHSLGTKDGKLLLLAATMYLFGSFYFFIGSVLFFPAFHDLFWGAETTITISVTLFIVGSVCYLLGGVLSMARTFLYLQDPEKCRTLQDKV